MLLFGFFTIRMPNHTINEIIESAMESIPSAVSVILPVNSDIVISATPMQASVITDCLAACCPLLKIAVLLFVLPLLSALLNVKSYLREINCIWFLSYMSTPTA